MRLVLTFALLASLAACDRKAKQPPQANAVTDEPPAPAIELAGKLDMTHRGDAFPTASFIDMNDKAVTIAKFHGQPVLVNLWATWCGPCVRELPSLDRLAIKTKGRLQILAVNQDDPASSDPVAYWADRHFTDLLLYRDPKNGLSTAFATGVLPTSVLYDARGREVWRIVGGLEWDGPRANTLLAPVIG